jgi:SOS-response transcriptional repressor LexA
MEIDSGGCALQEPFALQVLGADMEPEFPDRCVVIIEPSERASDGMYVFAEVEGVRWLRQYRRDTDGHQWLRALHPEYPEIALDGLEWQVLGVVIQRNIRRKVKQYNYTQDTASANGAIRDAQAIGGIRDLTGT